MIKSFIKSKHLKAALLASCALSVIDGNVVFAGDINQAEEVAVNAAPLGIRRVTVQTDRGTCDVIIGSEVNLEDEHLGDTGLRNLLQYLPSNLISLRLRNTGITHEGITALLRGRPSQHIRNLVTLDLGDNNIGVEGAAVIARKLESRLANVTTLNLENANLGAEGARQLTGGFGDRLRRAFLDRTGGYLHDSRFVSLGLKGNNIGDDGIRELVRRGRLPQNLVELDLSNNGLTTDAVAFLFDRASNQQRLPDTLRRLFLNGNHIGDAIVGVLNANPRIPVSLRIDLQGNDISDDTLRRLRDLIIEPPLDRDREPPLDRDREPPLDRDREPPLDRDPEPPLDRDPEPPLDRDPEPPLDRDREPPLDPHQPVMDRINSISDEGRVVHTNSRAYLEGNYQSLTKKHLQYVHIEASTTPEEALRIIDWVSNNEGAKAGLKNIEVDCYKTNEILTRLRNLITPENGFRSLQYRWW